MSSNKGTSSNSGGGGGGNNNNNSNNNQVVKEITKEVKKNLGLTAVGGIGAGNMGYVANNLTGRDKVMYGEEAATETKKAMANRGLGTYNAETGSFSNVVGNKIISGTDKIMYGNSGVMGSGDPTGVLSSIAISQPMFESQQKLKTLISGGMALMGIPFIPSAMAYDARRASYESYANNFAKAQSSASFTARVNTGGGNVNDSAMETANTKEQKNAETNYRTDAERKLALSRNAAALKSSRTFFNSSKQLITGSMV
tara:strand:+ start:267 stop:1034 length:768 start_codon:yes stop_codon:yes gene_type:complete